jgi:hypothetical protein
MLTNRPIANFKAGIDQLSDITSLPKGAARDALNVDIDNGGGVATREGFTLLSSMSGAHSLWGARDGTFGLYVVGTTLRRMIVEGGTPMSATILTGLTADARMSYFEHANEVFFSNGHQLGVVTRNSVRLLGVVEPPQPALSALAYGSLPAGKYSLACSSVSSTGEESGLSPLAHLTLAQQGGVALTLPLTDLAVRIYATPANGDVLYLVAELPPGLTTFDLTEVAHGKVADTQNLRRMPAGSIVRAFNGRLLVARGDVVWFSEPFRYGLTSPRHNFVRFNSQVTAIEPVAGGVFVGTAEAVYFLAGDGPGDFKQVMVSTNAPFAGASVQIPGSSLPGKLQDAGAGMAALWLGPHGYSIGMPNGTAFDVQADRISLPAATEAALALVHRDGVRQVLGLVETTAERGPEAAIDA